VFFFFFNNALENLSLKKGPFVLIYFLLF